MRVLGCVTGQFHQTAIRCTGCVIDCAAVAQRNRADICRHIELADRGDWRSDDGGQHHVAIGVVIARGSVDRQVESTGDGTRTSE